MGYYIDLQSISIDHYKKILSAADLIPSWMVLKEKIDENLDAIKNQGISNLNELQKALKSKDKVREFSGQSGLPEDYLNVLRRVVNGYHPKPNRFRDFPNLTEEVVEKLEGLGFKNTLHLYDEILTPEKRNNLSKKSGIDKNDVLKLAKLTDLSRVRWVNHTFAYVLLEAGYPTAESMAHANYQEMYETIRELNKEREIYKGNIGAHDMKMCIEAAQGLDFEIEY